MKTKAKRFLMLATRSFYKGCPIKKLKLPCPLPREADPFVRVKPIGSNYGDGCWAHLLSGKAPFATPTQFCSLPQREMFPLLAGLAEKDFKKLVAWVLEHFDSGGYGESKKLTTFCRIAAQVAGERGIDIALEVA